MKQVKQLLNGTNMKQAIVAVFLMLGVLFQAWFLLSQARQDLDLIAAAIGQHGLWRSAMFSQGRRFAQYVRFLNENIPPDGRVVLPSWSTGRREIGRTPFMQFFLAPRQVINCPDPRCIQKLSKPNTYILILGKFTENEATVGSQNILMFDDQWGLALPEGARPARQDAMPAFKNLAGILSATAWPCLWLALLAASGYFWVDYLIGNCDPLIKLPLGYGLGLSAISTLISLVSLLGAPLSASLVLAATGVLLAAALAARYASYRRRSDFPPTEKPHSIDIWQILFLLLGAIAGLVSVGEGYHATDEILLWGAKGYGIASQASIYAAPAWGTSTLAYPLHLPILIACFRLLFGETLPASKLAFPIYSVALSFVLYHTFIRTGFRRALAGPATLLVVTAPILFRHATLAYANLALGFYLFGAVTLLGESLRPSNARRSDGMALLGGLFLAAAAWTRPEGLALAWSGIAVTLGAAYYFQREQLSGRRLALLVSPLLVYSLFWWWIKTRIYAGVFPRSGLAAKALSQIASGNLHLREAAFIGNFALRSFLTFETWGFLGIALLTVTVFALARIRKWKTAPLALCVGLLYWGIIAGIYFATSYDTFYDISWWVHTGLDRISIPAVLLLWSGGLIFKLENNA
jgi:hypothetical protein